MTATETSARVKPAGVIAQKGKTLKEMRKTKKVSATIGYTTYNIEYDYDVPDSLDDLQKLIAYFRVFDDTGVIWVPGAEDDECEYGILPCPDAEYSQDPTPTKIIILTRGDEADRAFGENWDEGPIFSASILWEVPQDEYDHAVKEHEASQEEWRRGMSGNA